MSWGDESLWDPLIRIEFVRSAGQSHRLHLWLQRLTSLAEKLSIQIPDECPEYIEAERKKKRVYKRAEIDMADTAGVLTANEFGSQKVRVCDSRDVRRFRGCFCISCVFS